MKQKNQRGFTLVELLTVIGIIALITALAVPSIVMVNKNMKNKSVNTKVNLLLDSARLYAQQKPNHIKKTIDKNLSKNACIETEIFSDGSGCECTNGKCHYVYVISVKDLVNLGLYKSEKESDVDTCDVTNPKDTSICLDEHKIEIKLSTKNIVSVTYLGKDNKPDNDEEDIGNDSGKDDSGDGTVELCWCFNTLDEFDNIECYTDYDSCLDAEESSGRNCYETKCNGTPDDSYSGSGTDGGYCTNFLNADNFYTCFSNRKECEYWEENDVGAIYDCSWRDDVSELGNVVWK